MQPSPNPRSQGFTLIEMVMALSILSVGILGLAATYGSMLRAGEDREREIRSVAILSNASSALESVPFEEIARSFGPGSGQDQFWCDSDGEVWFAMPADFVAVGTIEIFNDESVIPATFSGLSPGIDLNANGTVEVGGVDDYQLLPVRVSVSYPNDPGARTHVSEFLLRP